jgi:hypothetical protein
MQIRTGMNVLGADMSEVGTVKEVRNNDFLLNRPMHRDVYVPFSAVQNVSGNQVILNVLSNQVDNMNWPSPSLT